jgi:DNA polymerase
MAKQGKSANARAKLALRAEKAMGLTWVPVKKRPIAAKSLGVSSPQVEPKLLRPSQAHPPSPVASRAASAVRSQIVPAATTTQQLLQLDQPFTSPLLSRDEKSVRLRAMDENEVKTCVRCRLCEQRTHTVFGEGDLDAQIMFIGEGPGENEDLQGRPFVGRAGDQLNKWIAAMGLRREQVFIANIVKCRPPGNREPATDEIATCTPYLLRQIEMIRPRVIITLGRPSSQYMLQTKISMGKLRGQWHDWRSIKLMPTYHPAYVLRNNVYETRAAVWSDLKMVMAELDLPIPKRATEK